MGGEVRKNDPVHGGSASGALFAERHVYMRSGAESRYVVLTRPLQIGGSVSANARAGDAAFKLA